MNNVAFIGAFHNEGERLLRLLRQTQPWFKHRVIALQGPEDLEIENVSKLLRYNDDTLILQDKLGFGEASFPEIMRTVRNAYPRVEWVFYMDGDELAEPSLLACMTYAILDPEAAASKGIQLLKRSNIVLPDGSVLPGIAEKNLRIWKVDCERPPKPHAWIEGIIGDPLFWPVGAIRETRNLAEYLRDQISYVKVDPGATDITKGLLKETYEHLQQFLPASEVSNLFRGINEEAWEMVKLSA